MNPNNEINNSANNTIIEPMRPPNAQPRTRKSGRFWFFTCGTLFLIFLCFCTIFTVFSGSIMRSLPSSGVTSDVTIDEKVVKEYGNSYSKSSNIIAVIEVANTVYYASQTDTTQTNNTTINAQLDKAKADSAVKAVVLRFNTPGGAADAAEPICRKIKEVNESKPVYSFIDTQGTSLGYLLPNCTKFIYARPESVTGSIGVIASLMDYNGIFENLGAKSMTITNSAGSQKAQEGLFVKESEAYKRYQSMLDEMYEYFVNKVWEGRKDKNNGLTYEGLRKIANGQVFSGKQAKEIGLVDKNAQYDDMLDEIHEKDLNGDEAQVVEYSVNTSLFGGIFGATSEFYNMLVTNRHSRSEMKVMMID